MTHSSLVVFTLTTAVATAIAPAAHADAGENQSATPGAPRVSAANQTLTAREQAIEKCKQAALPQDRNRVFCIDEKLGGDFGLRMQRGKLTTIRFPHELKGGTGDAKGLDVQVAGHRVVIKQTARRVRGNFFIHSKTGYTVAFDPEIIDPGPADSETKPPKLYVVVTLAEMERRQAEAQEREEELEREQKREAREKAIQARYRTAEQVLHSVELDIPPVQVEKVRTSPLVIERITWDGNEPYVRFSIEDRQAMHTSDIAEIRISNNETSVRADIVVIETPGDRDNRLPATLLPGKKAEGVVWIPEEFEGHPASLTMSIYGKNGLLLYADQIGDYTVKLVTKEEYARREAILRRARQLILGPSFALGACWLSDGVDDSNQQATGCGVVGLRLTKGITPMVAVEVDAVGGWTGSADFDTETRSARLGRFTASGVLRFGEWTIPYLRFGVGAQGASHDDDSSLEFDLIWTLGVGVTKRVGDHWLVGAGVSGNQNLDGASPSLQGGISVGYGWNP